MLRKAALTVSLAAILAGALQSIIRSGALPVEPAASKASSQVFTLTVVAQGVRNSKGAVGVLVFNSPTGWPDQVSATLRKKSMPAIPGDTEVTLSDLPAGDYAVVVLHDENENEKLDRGPLGIPIEQWGMSNNPNYVLTAPSFESARFHLASTERLYIQLH
jgi:uncharacterized protein (DUF2141 family)